jgi:hypothetical protein
MKESEQLNGRATTKGMPIDSVELSSDGGLDPAALVRLNIMLSNEVLGWCDSAGRAIHRASGTRISRSEIVRGILGGFVDANPLFSGCSSELHLPRRSERTHPHPDRRLTRHPHRENRMVPRDRHEPVRGPTE